MITLTIDSQRCDLAKGCSIEGLGCLDMASAESASEWRNGWKVTLLLPSTPRNDRVMGYAAEPTTAERFNAEEHRAVVEVDGVELMSGVVHLLSVESGGVCKGRAATPSYRIRITAGAASWAERAARTKLSDMFGDYSLTLDGPAIEQSWAEQSLVKFLPVHYDDYKAPYDGSSLYAPQRVLSVDDYYPFVRVADIVSAIFSQTGYKVESRFLQSEEFRKLHISGRYPSSGTSQSRLMATTGFCAGRKSEVSATADSFGRVYATPLMLVNSVGNFVDTASAADGEGLYNHGSVLSIADDGVSYSPTTTVGVSFEFDICYTTDYRILSREQLQGFDGVYIDTDCQMKFQLVNPYEDRRDSLQPNTSYKCVVFDHSSGATYRVVCRYGSTTSTLAEFSARTYSVVIPAAASGAVCELQLKGTDGVYRKYGGDWALYDGYVAESGTTKVELKVRTQPRRLNPSSRYEFNRIYLYGAAEGQRLTLSKECRMRSLFSASPSVGSQLSFADVVAYDVTQAELLESLRGMFNLRILSDERARKVYIEPYDDFYSGDEVDWSDRVLRSEPAKAEDIASACHQIRTLAYRSEAGGAVERFNREWATTLGSWSRTTQSEVALQGEKREVQLIFSPTLSVAGVVATAQSAMLLEVGDRDGDELADTALRVVCYEGLQPLPKGERWGFPSYGTSYPLAAFHLPGQFTLCFEDRDSTEGLHRYYDGEWLRDERRRSLTLSLLLWPDEVASLGDYGSQNPNVGSRFLLSTAGEKVCYNLQAVESYDARRQVARCRFCRCLND
ncbi:MAG: hypothetical protein IKU88_08000 [Alistipes sp.]|nr:hypothetical protein [Alistipes sp.]